MVIEDGHPILWQGDIKEAQRSCWETFIRLEIAMPNLIGSYLGLAFDDNDEESQRQLAQVNTLHINSPILLDVHRFPRLPPCNMSFEALRDQIVEAEKRLDDLRSQLHQAEHSAQRSNANGTLPPTSNLAVPGPSDTSTSHVSNHELPLDLDEYKRYGRQMIVPCIGLEGLATRWLRTRANAHIECRQAN